MDCVECSECRVKSSIRVSKSNRYQKSGVRHTPESGVGEKLERERLCECQTHEDLIHYSTNLVLPIVCANVFDCVIECVRLNCGKE